MHTGFSGATNSVQADGGGNLLESKEYRNTWRLAGAKGELSAIPTILLPPSSLLFVAGSVGIFFVSLGILFWKLTGDRKPTNEPVNRSANLKLKLQEPEDFDESKKVVKIFYGTQTGTAEGFAKALAEEAKSRFGNVEFKVVDLDEYSQDDDGYENKFKRESIIFLILATYGDGEPTDNAARLYKWLMQEREGPLLFQFTYGVFGLGNMQYEHFNKVALEVDKALEKQGAKRLVTCGLGDDDKCIEDDFSAWRDKLWPELSILLGNDAMESSSAATPYFPIIPEYRLLIHDKTIKRNEEIHSSKVNGEIYSPRQNGQSTYDIHHPCKSRVAIKKELHTPLSDRSCTHLEFDISDSDLSYEAGDHVGVYAQNSEKVVEQASKLLDLPLNMIFSLYKTHENGEPVQGASSLLEPFPGPCTLQVALGRYADLLSSPRKNVLAILASYAANKEEADRLKYLSSPDGKDEYSQWISSCERSLLEVLFEFPSVRVPLGAFFGAIAPRLQPRYYSISSSPRLAGNRIHVTCAHVYGPSPTGRIHEGVCSTWMKNALSMEEAGIACSWAPIFIKRSNFKLSCDSETPIVMIGPGTGLAPFRGFLQARAALQKSGVKLGPAVLFFGCRNRKHDFIYEEELKNYLQGGALSSLFVAFSRQSAQKEYVQDKIREQASYLWKLWSEGGYLYVCGDAKGMARDVHLTLLKVVQEQENVDNEHAEETVKEFTKEGRYLRDVW